jgi:hypothetical protein
MQNACHGSVIHEQEMHNMWMIWTYNVPLTKFTNLKIHFKVHR